jgi:hypothetical protein
MLSPTSCGTEVMASQATIPNSTTVRTKTLLQTSTSTATKTWLPSTTPTMGPPPDVELVNISVFPEFGDFNNTGQDYTLLGRVRNNTDQIMVFPFQTRIFNFTFEIWEYDFGYAKNYLHQNYSEDIEQYSDYNRRINCFLYPGDEGVFMYTTKPFYADHILRDYSQSHDGPLGIWYTYEGFYNVNPDIPLDYHPSAENLVFEIKNGILNFDFDVYVPDPKKRGFALLISYLILFDKEGKIINILKKDIFEFGGVKKGDTFHVHGTTATSMSDRQNRFVHTIKMTNEMIERIDHIEVFSEFETDSTCG